MKRMEDMTQKELEAHVAAHVKWHSATIKCGDCGGSGNRRVWSHTAQQAVPTSGRCPKCNGYGQVSAK
jgi:DnaJ-class molecular chaperone